MNTDSSIVSKVWGMSGPLGMTAHPPTITDSPHAPLVYKQIENWKNGFLINSGAAIGMHIHLKSGMAVRSYPKP